MREQYRHQQRHAWHTKEDAEADDAPWSGAPLRFPSIRCADVCGEIIAVGRNLDASRIGERYAVAGAVRGPLVDLDVRTLYLMGLTLFGCTVWGPQVFPALIKRIERKENRPLEAKAYPLTDIALAQSAPQDKQHIGKIVLAVN